jgi:rhodanese-related sulfurtransferase
MEHDPHVATVSVQEAQALVADDAIFLDVRAKADWDAGHVMHSVHVSLDDITTHVAHASRQRRVIVASRSGIRAEEAVRHLRTGGVDAAVLEGGLLAWQAAGGEFVATGGGPACLV